VEIGGVGGLGSGAAARGRRRGFGRGLAPAMVLCASGGVGKPPFLGAGHVHVSRSVTSMSGIVFKRNKSNTKAVHRSRQPSPDATVPASADRKEDESPSALAAKLKKRAKAKSKLSFGDEVRVLTAPVFWD